MTVVDTTTTFAGETHPAADVWPLLPDDELAELAASIAEIGLQDPITLDPAGRLLDGRNRLQACRLAGVDPTFVTYDGDPVPFILAKNGDRRHMSTGAKAMTTAVVLAEAGYRKNGRWQRGAVANPESGNSGKSWQNSMSQAGLVVDYAPALAAKVIAGDTSIEHAHKEAQAVKARAESEGERMKRLKADNPKLAKLVASGDMTLAEAEGAHREQQEQHERDVARHAKYLTEAATAWDRLVQVAEDRFPHFDEASAEIGETFRERLVEAAHVIRKGMQ